MAIIVHLSSVHHVLDPRIYYRMALSLAGAGYEVTLIALPAPGKVATELEDVDGLRIVTIPQPRSRFQRMFRTTYQVFRACIRERADIYHMHDPELIGVGLLLKILGKRVIWDKHEDLPAVIPDKYALPPWLSRPLCSLVGRAEVLLASLLDGIVAATPHIATRFPRQKTIVVQNFPRVDNFRVAEGPPYQMRAPRFVYIGAINRRRGAIEVVEAFNLAIERSAAELDFIGHYTPASFRDELVRMAANSSRIRFNGWMPQPKVLANLQDSRAGLCILRPISAFLDSYPTKMFEYMLAGIPVIVSDFPLWRQIIDEADCGLLVNPLDVEAIASAVCGILEHPDRAEQMGENGRKAVRDRFNWEKEATKLKQFYGYILSKRSGEERT